MKRCRRGHFVGARTSCKACRRRYEHSDKAWARQLRYRQSERGRAVRAEQCRRYREENANAAYLTSVRCNINRVRKALS